MSKKKKSKNMSVSYGVDKENEISSETAEASEVEVTNGATGEPKKKNLIEEINEMKANNEVDSPEFRDNMQKLEKVLGVDQINPFGTNELDIFEEKLKGMSKSDLQDLAYKVGLNPYQAQGSIKQNLTNEFKAYNRNNMRNIMPQSSTVQKLDPDNPQHAKTIKILGDI